MVIVAALLMPKEKTSFEGFFELQEGCGEGVKRRWEDSGSEGSKLASIPLLISALLFRSI